METRGTILEPKIKGEMAQTGGQKHEILSCFYSSNKGQKQTFENQRFHRQLDGGEERNYVWHMEFLN